MPRKNARLLTSPPLLYHFYKNIEKHAWNHRDSTDYTSLNPSPCKVTTEYSTLRISCLMWTRLYTLPPDPSPYKITTTPQDTVLNVVQTIHLTPWPLPYKITTHLSGYHAQCRPGYTPDPRHCSQWFSRTAECPAPSWVGRPVQLARGWSGHCRGLTELRNLIYSTIFYTGNYSNKTQVLTLFHSHYPNVNTITNWFYNKCVIFFKLHALIWCYSN